MALAARQSSQRQALVRRGFRTKKEAEAALHEAERRVRSGRLIDAGRITFGDYLVARWLPAIAADTKLKPTSVAGYRSMSRHLVASLGAVRLDQLTGDQLTTLYGIFCWAEGTTLHPNVITGTYRRIVDQAGLPPLPLHNCAMPGPPTHSTTASTSRTSPPASGTPRRASPTTSTSLPYPSATPALRPLWRPLRRCAHEALSSCDHGVITRPSPALSITVKVLVDVVGLRGFEPPTS